MVKQILLFGLLAVIAASCSKSQRWSDEQRREMRKELEGFRGSSYLKNLDDEQFVYFSDVVVAGAENAYPDYTALTALPAMQDTVTMWVIGTISDDISANFRNMKYLLPYKDLVAWSILPSGLTTEQQDVFYSCLAGKINGKYGNPDQFVAEVMKDDALLTSPEMKSLQEQCAMETALQAATELPIIE